MASLQNSLVSHLKGYIHALFKDIAWLYDKPSDWRRDMSRLLHELEYHGPRVPTIDLPAVAKHLDRCLDEGSFTPSNLPFTAVGAHGYPKFLGTLWKRIFIDGKLRDTPDYDAITALRQVYLGLKKLRLPCTQRRVHDELKKFFEIEENQKGPSHSWGDDPFGTEARKLSFLDELRATSSSGSRHSGRDSDRQDHNFLISVLQVMSSVSDIISAQFGDLHNEEDTELPKHGPGVVSNLGKRESKYSFPEWSTKLQAVFPFDYYGTPDLGESYNSTLEEWPDDFESPSRLITVPKTLKAPRLIAAEPVQNQWIQQLVRNQLENRLERTSLGKCVRLRSQERNQAFALRGSENGLTASIDLSSASDRLSLWTVERAFRCNNSILDRLAASRTDTVRNGIDPSLPELIRLKKFAPMGSAVTFPVQSIVYAYAALASVIHDRGWKITRATIDKAADQVTVFGDDILLPKQSLSTLVLVLEYLGLKVNISKTYGGSNFRESCGIDCIHGVDVTPVYFLNPGTIVPVTKASSQLEVANNFWRNGYWNVSTFVADTIANRNSVPIVGPSDTAVGLMSFCGRRLPSRKRWNSGLHVWDYWGVRVKSKTRTLDTDGRHRLMQWFIENPAPDTPWESGTRDTPVVTLRPGWIHDADMINQRELKDRVRVLRETQIAI